jgi:hypothetical protein
LCTASSSTTSSLTSIAAIGGASNHFKRLSDPFLHRQSTHSAGGGPDDENIEQESQRRRSTGRYSLLDALDLEYALLRAAARGSVGPYSMSESLHKLTFTQSLAFPALARSITSKRRRSVDHPQLRPLDPNESSLNLLAKFVTACVLVLVSFLVFFIVYKFSTTWGLLLLSPDDSEVNTTTTMSPSTTMSPFNNTDNATNWFDYHAYQRALLKRNQTLAEGFRRMFNLTRPQRWKWNQKLWFERSDFGGQTIID